MKLASKCGRTKFWNAGNPRQILNIVYVPTFIYVLKVEMEMGGRRLNEFLPLSLYGALGFQRIR